MDIKLCKDCALRDSTQNVCLLTRTPVDPLRDFCSHFTKELLTCELCGQVFLPPGVWFYNNPEDENMRLICPDCNQKISTCGTCVYNSGCLFKQPNFCPEEPEMITETIRQGNMILQRTIPNIKRIHKVCPQCNCFCEIDNQIYCARNNFGTCNNYKMKGDN